MALGDELISIIIPFYNGSAHVSTCVSSLQNQTYSNFEAIFIDDGSTDDTASWIERYQDKRFVILRQKKAGVSVARNLGLSNARGEYIAFMDIDDELEPVFLERQIGAVVKCNADVVVCGIKKIYANDKEEACTLPWEDKMLSKEQINNQLIPWSIWMKPVPVMGSTCRTMIRSSFWDENQIFFNENVVIAEDLLFLLAIYNRADRIYINSEYLYKYRIHPNSTVNKFRPDSLKRNISFHRIFVETLKNEGIYERNISQYQSNKASMYTAELSNFSRNPQLFKSRKLLIELRKELINEPFDWRDCDLTFGRAMSLWMLEHKLYSLLLILYRIKEWIRLTK